MIFKKLEKLLGEILSCSDIFLISGIIVVNLFKMSFLVSTVDVGKTGCFS